MKRVTVKQRRREKRATGNGARGTGHGARGTGHGARGTGHGARGTGHGARGTGNREPGNVKRGTGNGGKGVWDRVYIGNSPDDNSKWRTKERKRQQFGKMSPLETQGKLLGAGKVKTDKRNFGK